MTIEDIKKFSEEILNTLGPYYKENIYVSAMCIHLRNNNIQFQSEVIVPINYQGIQVGYERADIVIYEPFRCILEFKAQTQNLSTKEMAQLIKYQKNLDFEDGILINFGNVKKLEFQTNKLSEMKSTISIN